MKSGTPARWARGIAIVLALLAVATAGTAWWIIESLDLKRVVARVESALQDVTGRAVTIGSTPQLTFTPLLKLVVGDVTLGNMQGGTRPEMLKLERLEIGVSLSPLLEGRRPGLDIALIAPDLLLEVSEKGERNWILKLSPEEALARLKEAVAILEGKIGLDAVRIERASVRFEDRRDKRTLTLTVRQASLELGNDDNYELELDAGLNGKPVAISAGFRLAGAGNLVPARVKASLPGMALSAEGVVLPAWPAPGTNLKLALEFRDASELGNALGVRLGKFPPGKLDGQLRGTDQGMRVEALRLVVGRSSLNGDVEVLRFAPRLQARATLEGPVLDLGELLEGSGVAGTASRNKRGDGRIFSAEKIPLASLQTLDMDAQLKAGRLILPGPRELAGFQAHLSLANGRLSVDPLAYAAGGGQVSGRVRVGVAAGKAATIDGELQMKGVELDHLFKFAGLDAGQFKGARTDMTIRLATNGDSVRTWMAGLNGQARIVVGEGRLPAKNLNWAGNVVGQAVDVAIPKGGGEEGAILKCVVVNVPVEHGVVEIRETVAGETEKVVGAVSGTVDLRQERLDLVLHSQAVSGVGLANFASAAKLTGTLANPELAVNAQGAAAAGVRVGAAIATAGVSVLATSLARKSTPKHPCEAALKPR